MTKKHTDKSASKSLLIESQWQFLFFPAALVISLAGLTTSFIAHFPGGMATDPFVMWGMGWKWPWYDWHTPYISLLMTVSRILRGDPAVYLFFQLFLHWCGLYFCATAMRKNVGTWALLVPLLGFTPMFLGLSGFLHKTPLQASSFLFIFGVIYLHHAWGRRLNFFWVLGLLLLFLLAIPVRRFGYICSVPLLVYFLYILFRRNGLGSFVKYLIGALAISMSSLLIYNFIIYDILDSKRMYKIQAIYTYELAAIYALTGINYAPKLIKKNFSQHAVRKEYAKHKGMWRIMNVYKRTSNPSDLAYYKDAWKTAIRNHPDIWIKHRVHAFAKSLGYKIQMRGLREAKFYNVKKNVFGLQKSKNSLYLLVAKYQAGARNYLCMKPWIWMIVTYVMLFFVLLFWLRWHALREVFLPQIVLLISAGLFYPVYFLVSLSQDLRFTYWALTAAPLATLCILLILLTNWSGRHKKREKLSRKKSKNYFNSNELT